MSVILDFSMYPLDKGESLSPAESAASLYKLVAALTPEDKGIPVNVDGKPIPW